MGGSANLVRGCYNQYFKLWWVSLIGASMSEPHIDELNR